MNVVIEVENTSIIDRHKCSWFRHKINFKFADNFVIMYLKAYEFEILVKFFNSTNESEEPVDITNSWSVCYNGDKLILEMKEYAEYGLLRNVIRYPIDMESEQKFHLKETLNRKLVEYKEYISSAKVMK